MIEWVPTEGGVAAVGRSGSVRLVRTEWERTTPTLPLPYPADAGMTGRLTALELDAPARPEGLPTDGYFPSGQHLVAVGREAGVGAAVRFEGPARVATTTTETRLSFRDASPVSIGVRDAPADPETVAVPRSPAGIAAAVAVAGGRLPDGPERSFPPRRPHPPLVSYDDVPAPNVGERSIRFAVPDDLDHVLVAAPLAYYLGADLSVGADAPLLSAPDTGFEYAFGSLPSFASEVADALRRVVHLDRCARDVEAEDLDASPLTDLGLDPDAVRAVPPATRYATFLDADVDTLPDWHLATYAEADYDRARALPDLLDRLSVVYPPEASEMSPRDLLSASLDEFYRGAVSISPLAPELGVGDAHAWLADGEVVDAFKATPRAFDNARSRDERDASLTVAVVLNDPAMDDELAVADAYRERASAIPLSVEVHESLPTDELAAVLERRTDFVHYVGHCEAAGLECRDGFLPASTLDRSGARAFFLNACGSYREGEALVEGGSVAGAVTLEKVLNEQAAKVGTAFGRLLVSGFSVERALSLARRRIMMGKDYAAVGDATARVAPSVGEVGVLVVEEERADGYAVRYDAAPNGGGSYRDPFTGDRRSRGEPSRATLDRAGVSAFVEEHDVPARFDGDLRWPDELTATLDHVRGLPLHPRRP